MSDLQGLAKRLDEFAKERDWDRFHTPKNLAMAVAGEAGELVEIFQWLTAEESVLVMEGSRRDDVEDEIADVLIYLVRLADILGVDLVRAAHAKVDRNAERFEPREAP